MIVVWLSLKLSRLRSSMVSLQMHSPKLRKMRPCTSEVSSAYERHSHFKWRCYKNGERFNWIPQMLWDLMNFILESLKNLRKNLVLYLLICSNILLIRVKSPRNDLWLTFVHFIRRATELLPSNYRLVSLTCKMLEHIVCTNIMAHLDEHKLLSDKQHSFGKNRSCETQLITVINDWAKILDMA